MFFRLSFFLLIWNTVLTSAQPTYLHVNLHSYPVGMFSVFNYVLGVLHDYESHQYAGLKVDFEQAGLYYDSTYGPNWWEYYCEPIRLGVQGESAVKQFNWEHYARYAYFVHDELDRKEAHRLIKKYIKVKPFIQEKVDNFISKNFLDYTIVGVHYRGTDKMIIEAPYISYKVVANKLMSYIKKNKLSNYRIFIASDELDFIKFMKEMFSHSVITYDSERSIDGKPLHLESSNKYLQGEEALIDCLLLSRCDVLIRTSSNLSLWSTFFNAEMPVIYINKEK